MFRALGFEEPLERVGEREGSPPQRRLSIMKIALRALAMVVASRVRWNVPTRNDVSSVAALSRSLTPQFAFHHIGAASAAAKSAAHLR